MLPFPSALQYRAADSPEVPIIDWGCSTKFTDKKRQRKKGNNHVQEQKKRVNQFNQSLWVWTNRSTCISICIKHF